jgi:hypothetical protein
MYLYEGQTVKWNGIGDPARGHIVAIAGKDAVHVKWATGPNSGDITVTDVYDLDPFVSNRVTEREDPLHLTAVRRAYDQDGESGVLNFLASHKFLDTWQSIAKDVLDYTEQRIRIDASMELVDEQLSTPERTLVIQAAALALLRDAFTDD